MTVLAIDPGLNGSYALLQDGALVLADELPRIGVGSQARLSGEIFARLVKDMQPSCAIIEAVSPRPGEGVSSSFRFGRACGSIDGVLQALHVPQHYVSPAKWKRHFGIPGKQDNGAEVARQYAVRLWPAKAHIFQRKKDHGRADAALIGRWFVETNYMREAA
jgi:crossover junction endodeoxyribonuclease RuvC